MNPSKESRLEVANNVLRFFAPDTRLEIRRGRVFVTWQRYGANAGTMTRQWMTRGQDFYPVWYQRWCHGGTCSTALSQLVRWIQGKPTMPMCQWEYWLSPTVHLASGNPALLTTLREGGYPKHANCVLCGEQVVQWDWWSLNGVTGPCCHHDYGCKQKGKVTKCFGSFK